MVQSSNGLVTLPVPASMNWTLEVAGVAPASTDLASEPLLSMLLVSAESEHSPQNRVMNVYITFYT